MRIFLLFCSSILAFTQNVNPTNNPIILIDASPLPTGYSLEYKIHGTICKIEKDEAGRHKIIEQHQDSGLTHSARVSDSTGRTMRHVLTFDADEKKLCDKTTKLKINIIFSIFDEKNDLLRTRESNLFSTPTDTQIIFKINGTNKQGKPNILVMASPIGEIGDKKTITVSKHQ